jgi:hypothetical protein
MVRHIVTARTCRGRLLAYALGAAGCSLVTPEAASAQVAPAPSHVGHAQGQAQGQTHRAAIVRLTALGSETLATDSIKVLVWTTGSARVGVGAADPTALTDTLRLSSLPAITADVSDGDVHVRLLSPGRMRLGGDVSGGRVVRFTATGRHIVVLRGGVGADTITDP